MKKKYICLDFCNGELMEEKELDTLKEVKAFVELAIDPLIIYGNILYKGD